MTAPASAGTCVCTNACKLLGFCPNKMYDQKPEHGRFEDIKDWTKVVCRDPNHQPPSHICVPPGKQYRHICPTCSTETLVQIPGVLL